MARQLRVEFPGAIYHVAVRMLGAWRKEQNLLFEDDADRNRFIDRLSERVEQFNIRLYLFVCMANHFHMVFETPHGNCGKFMQSLTTAYTVYFNRRHGRHGHLVDGRYRAKLVAGDEYLLALSRYVHLNPVCVGMIKDKPIEERIQCLRQYAWSSYPSYIGERKAFDFLDCGPMLGGMSGKRRQQSKRYQAFVESGLVEDDDDFRLALKASPHSIGSDGFRVWVDELYQKLVENHRRPEDVSFRCISEPLSSDVVLGVLADVFAVGVERFRRRIRSSPLRGVAACMLVRYAGLNQRQVAEVLSINTGSAVGAQMRKVQDWMTDDRTLRRQVDQALEQLNRLHVTASSPKNPLPVNVLV